MDERIRKRVRFAYKVFLLPIWECSKIVWNELDSSRRGWWNAGRWEQFTLKTRKPSAGFFLERFLVFTDMSSMALNPSVLTVLPVPALIRAAESQPPNWPPCHQPFPSPSTLPHTQDFLRMIDHGWNSLANINTNRHILFVPMPCDFPLFDNFILTLIFQRI